LLRWILPTPRAESLALFWCIDTLKADSVIRIRGIEHSDRIAILNTNYSTLKKDWRRDISSATNVWLGNT
jgi:hypothetical protein